MKYINVLFLSKAGDFNMLHDGMKKMKEMEAQMEQELSAVRKCTYMGKKKDEMFSVVRIKMPV